MELTTAVASLAVTVGVLCIGAVFGAGKLFQRVNEQENRVDAVLTTLLRLEVKIDGQDKKLDAHVQYHLEQKA